MQKIQSAAEFSQVSKPSNPDSSHSKLYFKSDGKLYKLNSDGTEVEIGTGGSSWVTAPTDSSDTGTAGQIAYDSDYFYVCVATNNWKRTLLSAFHVTTYTYSSDGDSNGVFTGIGTLFGGQSWTNPATAGYITITASNLASGSLASLVNHDASDTFDNPMTNNWFTFDLGATRRLRVSKWSFRMRSSGGNNPTAIDLQGSNDSTNWTTIDSQTGLTSTANTWNSFTVTGQTVKYRYFRLLRQGTDDGGNNYFTAGEFELYGDLAHE